MTKSLYSFISLRKQIRRGSVLLFAIGLTALMAILAISFSRQTIDSRYNARRQIKSMAMRMFARAAAHFTALELQEQVDQNNDHWLRKNFLISTSSTKDFEQSEAIDISAFNNVMTPFFETLEYEGSFSYSIKVIAKSADFGATEFSQHFFPTEKIGFVNIEILTTIDKISETFRFVLPVKVTASLIPGLSKFTLFIRNASDKENITSSIKFNLVAADSEGNLNGVIKPLILDNGFTLDPQEIKWKNFFCNPVGLVYLGGGETRLNLAASVGPNKSGIGEAFHLYMNSKTPPGGPSPFYIWKEETFSDARAGHTQFLRYDSGISCNFDINPLRKTIGDQLNHHTNPGQYLHSSIFRLFGTDTKPSPTIVFGEVYRGFISLSLARTNPAPPGVSRNEIFSYPENYQEFCEMRSLYGQGQILKLLYPDNTNEALDAFRDTYASDISYTPYNLSLAYIATNNIIAGPIKSIEPDPLAKLMNVDGNGNIDLDSVTKLPAEFGYSEAKELEDLVTLFCKQASIEAPPSNRYSRIIDLKNSDEKNLFKILKSFGLIEKNTFKPRGWVLIKNSPKALVLNDALKIESNGAILFQGKTDLVLNGGIDGNKSNNQKWVFQLITLKGNIVVNSEKIDASLIAPEGQISFLKESTVCGSLIMKNLSTDGGFMGGHLIYNPGLAALPFLSGAPKEEASLAFSFKPFPFLVE